MAARAFVGMGDEVVIATNDKDLFQLVDDGCRIYSTNKTDADPVTGFGLLGVAKLCDGGDVVAANQRFHRAVNHASGSPRLLTYLRQAAEATQEPADTAIGVPGYGCQLGLPLAWLT